jgi:hypothetical protein
MAAKRLASRNALATSSDVPLLDISSHRQSIENIDIYLHKVGQTKNKSKSKCRMVENVSINLPLPLI